MVILLRTSYTKYKKLIENTQNTQSTENTKSVDGEIQAMAITLPSTDFVFCKQAVSES